MRKAKIFVLNAVILTVTSLLISTTGMFFNVYISNKIGAQAMGLFQLVMSVYTFAVTLALSGISLASTRLVAEELAVGAERSAKRAMRKCIVYSLSFGLFSSALLFINAPYIANYWLHSKLTMKPLHALSVSLPFISMSSAIGGYFTAVRRVVKSASAQILEQFIRISFTIYALNLLMPKGLEYSCFAIVLGGAVSEIISFLYLYVMYRFDKKRYKDNTNGGKNLTNRLLAISLPVAFSSYIRSGLATFKQIIIPISLEKSGVSCDIALAKYGIIRGMVMPVILFPSAFLSAFSSLLVPEIAQCHIQKNHKRINYIISRIFKITLLFSICVSGIFISFSNELGMAIYKNQEAALFIKMLAPLITVMYFDNIVDGLLKGLNEQVNVVRINIIDTLATIVLIYVLLPAYSINGYIIVIFISEILNGYLSIRRLFKVTHFEFKLFSWVIKPVFAITAAIIIIKLFVNVNLITDILLVFLAYMLLLALSGCINKKDFTF